MSTTRAVTLLALATLALSPPAFAKLDSNNQCINERDIDHEVRPDDQTILFYMRDHKVWKNTLQVRCFGLKHEPDGFSYQPTDPGTEELCSNQVTIRLNSFRSFCQLGDFTPVK